MHGVDRCQVAERLSGAARRSATAEHLRAGQRARRAQQGRCGAAEVPPCCGDPRAAAPGAARPDVHAARRPPTRPSSARLRAAAVLLEDRSPRGFRSTRCRWECAHDFEAAIAEGATHGARRHRDLRRARPVECRTANLPDLRIHRRRQHGARPDRRAARPGQIAAHLRSGTGRRGPRPFAADSALHCQRRRHSHRTRSRRRAGGQTTDHGAGGAPDMAPALRQLRPLIISVAAGIRTASFVELARRRLSGVVRCDAKSPGT